MKNTTTLFRPVNDKELELIKELEYKAFPPRLPEQPIFYPVMNEEYATQITRMWNVNDYGAGYVTKFEVDTNFLKRYEIKNVGGAIHDELWVPSEELDEFNQNIVGLIEVISEFKK
ncbi:ADP-ribosylation/crystallin J1 [Subsaxibacter sp. CAU 1640]|uniref:ADP-ribosylation/crystallin J1 n=1 Tax=Subsaxibacter sp. CAU 1640 TaxID=2933271 RepID=UPI002003EB5C|nr:ADP-ribosylation/crystallin J1 [Subsaxibacter sp. CAU 1640]MCK7591865.1 ADP-ribosylation/crystallin J1 [Subsaxibacter sp. CAU 1640]